MKAEEIESLLLNVLDIASQRKVAAEVIAAASEAELYDKERTIFALAKEYNREIAELKFENDVMTTQTEGLCKAIAERDRQIGELEATIQKLERRYSLCLAIARINFAGLRAHGIKVNMHGKTVECEGAKDA